MTRKALSLVNMLNRYAVIVCDHFNNPLGYFIQLGGVQFPNTPAGFLCSISEQFLAFYFKNRRKRERSERLRVCILREVTNVTDRM
jgi:hypothetical protein